jgi:hypothetical protein
VGLPPSWRSLCVGQCVRRDCSKFHFLITYRTNRWLLRPALHQCFVQTQPKLIIVDAERADRIEPIASRLAREAGTTGILVLESHEGKGKWECMRSWNHVLNNYSGDSRKVLDVDPGILPEDNATVIFSSGTCVSLALSRTFPINDKLNRTGSPKGVLSTQRSFLTNVRNVSAPFLLVRPHLSSLG